MGTLYLVATPIGNLEDFSLRALRILREASLIAAEDTRHTRKLLDRHDIHRPIVSYHEHNKKDRAPEILEALELGDVALVSDAGTPGLSDPGYELVRSAIASRSGGADRSPDRFRPADGRIRLRGLSAPEIGRSFAPVQVGFS